MKNVKITKLQNGLTIISDFNSAVETVLCGVWASVGSRDEMAEVNGISHFLEHMAFKGTLTRSYTDIAEIIEDIGGDINAYTSKDHTFFYTKTLKEYLEICVDILSDIVQNSVFDEGETEKERNVILQEYYNSLDTPDDIIFDYFAETAYPNQPLGRNILGSENTIKSITSDTLKNYMKSNYCADNMYFIVSGNFDYEKMVDCVNKYFTNLCACAKKTVSSAKYKGGYFIKDKNLEQVHCMIGFEATDLYNRRDVFCETILVNALGGGMSSRLFQEIREKQNLVYGIYSGVNNYVDTGNAYIYTATEPKKVNKVIDAVVGEISKICRDGILEKELCRAKVCYKANVLMSLENSSARARILGRQMQNFGKVIPFEESIQMIEGISLDDIKRIAEKMFTSSLTVVGLGNCDEIYDGDVIKQKFLNGLN